MKPPTENGYYWVKVWDNWEIIKFNINNSYVSGIDGGILLEEIEEWGDKIEHDK